MRMSRPAIGRRSMPHATVRGAPHAVGQVWTDALIQLAAVMAPCEAVARTHVLAQIVEDAPIGQFGQRGIASSHHREQFTGLPPLPSSLKSAVLVVGTPRHRSSFGSNTGRRTGAPARAECKRDAGLHGTDPSSPGFRPKPSGGAHTFRASMWPRCATAEQPASQGLI